MNYDTSTIEGRDNRLNELVKEARRSGNKPALVRLIGGSINDFGDYCEADAGEPPKGAEWN
jgi:hypothetical protein